MEKVLPKNWISVKSELISDITDYVANGSFQSLSENVKAYDYEEYAILLRLKDFNSNFTKSLKYVDEQSYNFLSKSKIKEGDLFISNVGNPGICHLVPNLGKPITLGPNGIRLRAKKYGNISFIKYYLQSPHGKKKINEITTGTAQLKFNKTDFRDLIMPLPPLAEQERIVAKLDALFEQHGLMQKALERIPQLLKDFHQQVLTQAVTGKLTEEWREGKRLDIVSIDTLKEKLNEEVAVLNEEHIEEGKSRIRINPIQFINHNNAKWPIFTVESTCIAIVDCLHETAKFSVSGYKIIDTNSIEPFKINEKKIRFVDSETYKKWVNRLTPKRGDIVYTREGSIGNVVMIPVDKLYCIGQRTMLFRFSTLLNESFCEIYMNSQKFRSQVLPHIKGVASQHVNIRDLRTLEIPIPSLQEQEEIIKRVESLFAKTDAIEERYQKLKTKIDYLPQTILHTAFKGELTLQLPTDGDATELLAEIIALKNEVKGKKK